VRLPEGGDHGRPIVSAGSWSDTIAPGAYEDIVHDQHGHVAADSVALTGDLDQRLDYRGAQRGSKGVELNDVRPSGKVRIAAIRQDSIADFDERRRVSPKIRGGT
jgi:hypothetical protein